MSKYTQQQLQDMSVDDLIELYRSESDAAQRGRIRKVLGDETPHDERDFNAGLLSTISAQSPAENWHDGVQPGEYVREQHGMFIPAEVRSDESIGRYLATFGEFDDQQEFERYAGSGVTPGAFLRHAAVGKSSLDAEQRTLLSGTDVAGGFTVPAPLFSVVIDAVRNQSRVLQAGARTIPMTSRTLDLARVNAVPAGAWRAEGDPIAEEAITFTGLTLTAKSVSTLVKASIEFLQDSAESESFIGNTMSESIALAIDRAALYGDPSGTGDADEPEGVKFVSGVGETATVGMPTSYAPYVSGIWALRQLNHEPNSVIYSPRDAEVLELLTATDNQPLRAPASWNEIRRLTTNQIATDEGVGTDESSAFIADWSNLLWGVRSTIQVRLDEHYVASEGAIGFAIMVRTDVQLARPGAFHVLSGITAS